MKHLLLTTIAAVLVVGCGPSVDIHDAARTGNIEAVKQHVAAGADVNAKNKYENTPLHRAAYDGHKEIVELLITAGADVNANSDNGTPLDTAIRGNQPEIADLLLKHGGKYGSIRTAAGGGDIEAVKEFLAAGADVNAKSKYGGTPLQYAAAYGHKETAELLVAKGADVNAKDKNGYTPLFGAALEGHKEVAELLIAKGADVNAKDDTHRWTPLHQAAKSGRKEIAELLIAEGAEVNAKNDSGTTPLDWAIDFKQTELADLLRKHGAKTAGELEAASN
jgi:ankyrin repeat protein